MEHTCSECLRRGKIILRPALVPQNYKLHIDSSLGKTLEGSEGTSKEKAHIGGKMP